MSEELFTTENLLEWSALLEAIPGDNPSGVSLRNTPAYDRIRDSLKPQDPVASVAKPVNYSEIISSASNVIATKSKDLDVAVWLTEALVRHHSLCGLAEGLRLIQHLLDRYWPTIFPEIDPDDGDEGFRAKPLNRLNTAFVSAFLHLPITQDGSRTVHEFNASCDVPTVLQADESTGQREKRERALAEGLVSPEELKRSVDQTSGLFYEQMLSEVRSAVEAAQNLQRVCEDKFKTDDRPYLTRLCEQLSKLALTVEAAQRFRTPDKPRTRPEPPPPPPPPAPPPPPPPPTVESPPTRPLSVSESRDSVNAEVPAPDCPGLSDIFQLAATMRRDDPADPVPYMLLRSWRFGPMLSRGSSAGDALEPPSTELKVALRRAYLNNDWFGVLENTERGMQAECGTCWLDLQQYSARACRELGHEATAAAIRGLTATYLRAQPWLQYAVMLDGSPAASPDTLTWIRTEVESDPLKERTESLEEVRSFEDDPFDGKEPDAFDIAMNELNAGRFGEAVRVLTEASAGEETGRGKLQRRIQLARICMEGGQQRIALPLLQDICAVIDSRQLDGWESADFVAVPLAMLYRCYEHANECEDRRRLVYDRICSVAPLKALELTTGS